MVFGDKDELVVSRGNGVKLSTEAREAWVSWYRDNRGLKRKSSGLTAGFYAKLSAHVARFALILHVLAHPDDPRSDGERVHDGGCD